MRYINLALILKNGNTVSTQVWTSDRSEAMQAFDTLVHKAYVEQNPAVVGVINDGKQTIRFAVDGMRARIIPDAV